MSAFCDAYSQNCSYRCCDRYGQCPYYSSDCYYYYNTNSSGVKLSPGATAGVAVGVILFFVGIGLLIYFCRRRQAQMAINSGSFPANDQTTIIIPNQQTGGYGMPQAYPQPYQQQQPIGYGTPNSYPQPYGQPGYDPSRQIIINEI